VARGSSRPVGRPSQSRAVWERTNHAVPGGFKANSPDGWVDTSGPVWFYGSDSTHGWLNPIDRGMHAGVSSITRAVTLITNRIASTQWLAPGNPRWLRDPMLLRPDASLAMIPTLPLMARLPASVFWAEWIRAALLWGMGWIGYVRDTEGQPRAGTMFAIHPAAVTWAPETGRWSYWTPAGTSEVGHDGHVIGTNPGIYLLPLRNPTLPPHPESGITPGTLAYHAAELGLIDSSLAYASGTFTGAGVPSGYLKVNQGGLTPEQAQALKTQWLNAHGSARTVAILSSSVDYQPVAISPVDAALVEMRKLSLLDVANAFGVPGYMLGAEGPSMTYSNVEMEAANLYEFTLRPWAVAVEETLSALLPGSQVVNIKVEGGATGGPNNGPVPVPAANVPADVPQG
jgi:hypothetical protein